MIWLNYWSLNKDWVYYFYRSSKLRLNYYSDILFILDHWVHNTYESYYDSFFGYYYAFASSFDSFFYYFSGFY